MMAKLLELKEEMRRRMHWPISEQGEWLKQVVGGFFNYHAVPTNSRALAAFRHHVRVLWGSKPICGTAPGGIECARVRSLLISDKGDRPRNRLAELGWIRRSTFFSFMG